MVLLLELDTVFELSKEDLETHVHPLFERVSDKLISILLITKYEDKHSKHKISLGEDKYPSILFQVLSQIFSYKAKYSHYPNNEDDERTFYLWETLCNRIYPGDWDAGDGYLFQENLKRLYEKYSPKASAKQDSRFNIDDMMRNTSST